MPDITKIDNAALLPRYVPEEQVTLDENGTPDWATQLILAQVRIATATPEGTLQAAVRVLDHYAEMGVNGLWLCPVYEPGEGGNGYTNLGVHTIDPAITGTGDYEAGRLVLRDFVRQAHARNIRILLDIITWGTVKGSPLHEQHPAWYTGLDEWGGDAFDWNNEEFKRWYIDRAVELVMVTEADGLRYDVEPRYAGYEVAQEIRRRLQEAGRKPFMMSEAGNERRGAYDCEQIGVTDSIPGYYEETPVWYFLQNFDLVDSIRQGKNIGSGLWKKTGVGCTYRFYVNTVTCHDHRYPVVCGNRLAIGYQAIFAPFIPQWYIGEEWNNPRNIVPGHGGSVLYFNTIDWEAMRQPENAAFYEAVKRMIRVRRQYPDIFGCYPPHFTDTNICPVEASGLAVRAYARYSAETALLIIPNTGDAPCETEVTLPRELFAVSAGERIVTDAMTGETVCRIPAGEERFTVTIPAMDQRVLAVQRTESCKEAM